MQREMVHGQGGGNHHQQQQQQQQLPRYGAAAATGVARASKKSKPKKVPQRGLGVAQLEKLRIEEQKMEGASAAAAAMSVSGAAPHLGVGVGGLGHLITMHPPPLPLLPRPGADGGLHCGYPPVLWDPAADPTMQNPYRRSLCPPPPLPTVSMGLSLTAASSSHPTEPPSNQMYSSSGSAAAAAADEDREAAGVDRPWPFVFEGLNTTAFRTTAAAGKAPLAARTTREAAAGLPDACAADLSRYEFRATNYFSSNASYPDWSSSEFGHCKSSKEKEPAPAYHLALNAQPAPRMKQPPALPSIQLPEFRDFGVMQPQHGSASASSRPFYSFMPVGPVRSVRREKPLSGNKADDSSDDVDLELKL